MEDLLKQECQKKNKKILIMIYLLLLFKIKNFILINKDNKMKQIILIDYKNKKDWIK